MRGMKVILGFFALVVLIFAAYAVLRTVPIDNCGENGSGLPASSYHPVFPLITTQKMLRGRGL